VQAREGLAEPELASIDRLRAKIALLPLVSRQVQIKEFILEGADINLHQKADGSANWTPAQEVTREPAAGGPLRGPGNGDIDLQLGDVALQNATISFRDDSTGVTRNLTDLDLSLGLASFDTPLDISLTGTLDDLPVSLDTNLGSPRAFLNGEESSLIAELGSDFGTIKLDGNIPPGSDFAFLGSLSANLSALERLSQWAGVSVQGISAVERLDLTSALSIAGSVIEISQADATLAGPALDARYTGDATLADGARFDGKVSFSSNDIDRLRAAAGLADEALPIAISSTSVSGDVSGTGERINLNNAVIDLKGDNLSLVVNGNAVFAQTLNFDGTATLASENLRALAAETGAELPPGDNTFQSFVLSGKMNGDLAVSYTHLTLPTNREV